MGDRGEGPSDFCTSTFSNLIGSSAASRVNAYKVYVSTSKVMCHL